ncbi:MAG: GtrA family protein [Rhizomicrobium sp.]
MTALSAISACLLQSRFLRFGLVGTAGFVVNEAALWVVHHLIGLNNYWSWPPAFIVAVTFTWWGNRVLTFYEHAARSSLMREWGKFVVANGLGAIANYLLYVSMLRFAPPPADNPYLALAAGTLLGLVFNFTLSKRFVFRSSSHSA